MKEKPLPKPPNTPFGRKRNLQQDEKKGPLMAEQMAQAMAEGKLEEFLQQEMSDNEQAKALAKLMMGMTGMLPPEASTKSGDDKEKPPEKISQGRGSVTNELPEDILRTVHTGDVQGLMGLLAREHKKRMPDTGADPDEEEKTHITSYPEQPAIEREIIDQLIKIATDNNLSLDWLLFRAIKRYIQEYQKTGRL